MRRLFFILIVLAAGCSDGQFPLAPISGTVTFDGEPLEGAEVVFAPMENDNSVIVGPASVGYTDQQGRYTLKTVRGAQGAIVTNHRVSVGFGEIDEAAVAAKVDAITEKNLAMPERKVVALEKKIRKSMMNKMSIPESYNKRTQLRFEVTGPTDDANFDLNSDGS